MTIEMEVLIVVLLVCWVCYAVCALYFIYEAWRDTPSADEAAFRAKIRDARTKVRFRQVQSGDLEAWLESLDAEPLSREKFERMLRKINGEEPMFENRDKE